MSQERSGRIHYLESAARRLREFNPHLDIVAVPENISPANAARLVAQADLVVDCALTTIQPGTTACLACLYPEPPPYWSRQFPVFGAVSGMIGCLAAMEAIKVLARFGGICSDPPWKS